MVEGTALEMRRTCKRTVGSNPTLSANEKGPLWGLFRLGGAELFVRAQGAARQKICCI